MSIVLLVTGGRNYGYKPEERKLTYSVLNAIHRGPHGPITQLRHGCARGFDSLCGEWARENGVPEDRHPAEWNKYGAPGQRGNPAGRIRNKNMVDALPKPDLCLAAPGGTGTADCVRKAKKAGITVAALIYEDFGTIKLKLLQ